MKQVKRSKSGRSTRTKARLRCRTYGHAELCVERGVAFGLSNARAHDIVTLTEAQVQNLSEYIEREIMLALSEDFHL